METREKLARLAHEQWSGWIEYMFSKCKTLKVDGENCLIIPAWAVERWGRQKDTLYGNLSEDEKNSDRVEADRFLKVFFAPDGLVSKLVDICETTLDFAEAGHKHTKALLKNPRPTPGIDEFFIEVRAILAEAKERVK